MPQQMIPPPYKLGPSGSPRKIGVEVEVSNIDCRSAAELVQTIFGGDVVEDDSYRFRLIASTLGDFTVELDMRHAHPHRKTAEKPHVLEGLEAEVRAAVGDVGSLWLPIPSAWMQPAGTTVGVRTKSASTIGGKSPANGLGPSTNDDSRLGSKRTS